MPLSASSPKILATVCADMQAVVNKCAATFPLVMVVDQGNRTAEQEMALWLASHNIDGTENGEPWRTGCNGYPKGAVAPNGAIGTGVSRHQGGKAVDIVVQKNGKIIWAGTDPVYLQLAEAMKKAAAELNIPLTCGRDFPPPSKPDFDHFEITES